MSQLNAGNFDKSTENFARNYAVIQNVLAPSAAALVFQSVALQPAGSRKFAASNYQRRRIS